MGTVSFGVSLNTGTPLPRREDLGKFQDLVRMAEDYGAEALGTFDTAFIGGDAFVRATMMATASTRARVGLRPTNPITREPQIMASFLASIDGITGGRAFMDIASGDSAVFNIGYAAAPRARIEDYVRCVRDLLAAGEGHYQGRPQRVRWAKTAVRPRVPISICAEGPKMLHLAGRIGVGQGAGLRVGGEEDEIEAVRQQSSGIALSVVGGIGNLVPQLPAPDCYGLGSDARVLLLQDPAVGEVDPSPRRVDEDVEDADPHGRGSPGTGS